ncbi:MAG: universal stress protein [Ferruginibacter sp.]
MKKNMTPTFKNILVPTDFSEPGSNALKIAIELCKKHTAVLHLLYVVENRYIVTAPAPEIAMSALITEIDQKARSRLYGEYESIIKTHQISVQIHMPTGIPYDEICQAASEMPIDLIVIGTHGASGINKSGMGTTAYGILKNCIKPVLTIPPNFEAWEFKKILFPIRPVQGLKAKYEFLNTFLKNNDAAIHFATLCLEDEDKEELLFNNKEELYEFLAMQKNSNFSFNKKLYICKNYSEKVLLLSEILDVDLVVINSTFYYEWIQFMVGPFTQQVVNYSKVPVLSFRQGIDIYNNHNKQKKQPELNKASLLQK